MNFMFRNLKAGIWLIPTATWLILSVALYPSTGLLQPLMFTPDAVHAKQVRAFLEERNIPYLVEGAYNILVGSKVRQRAAHELAQRGLLGLNKGARLFGFSNDPEATISKVIEDASHKIDQAEVAIAPNTIALHNNEMAYAYIRVVTNQPLQQDDLTDLQQLVSAYAPSLPEERIIIRSVARESLALAHTNHESNDLFSMADGIELQPGATE